MSDDSEQTAGRGFEAIYRNLRIKFSLFLSEFCCCRERAFGIHSVEGGAFRDLSIAVFFVKDEV